MIDLWLNATYVNEEWNISEKIDELSTLFRCIKLPSTTTRIPRLITYHRKYKANEYRVLLLFGHVIFKKFLRKRYYNHLLQLVALMHVAENTLVKHTDHAIMQSLSENFVFDFPKLYTDRHCVQVVHSVLHIPATVRDFGPLTNYTTFGFENDLSIVDNAILLTAILVGFFQEGFLFVQLKVIGNKQWK